MLLIFFIAFGTWIYPIVVRNWATLYIPLTHNLPRTPVVVGAWLSAGGASGAAICAFLLAWPLGYLTKEKPVIIGVTFGLITSGLPIFVLITTSINDGFNGFIASIVAVEQLSFLAASVLFAYWGSHVGNKMTRRGKKEDVPH